MSVLDQIFRKVILQGPETVNASYESPSVSIDGIQDEFSISMEYDNGATVDMNVTVQYSNDDINFASDPATLTNITSNDGYVLYDIGGSGAQFVRVAIEVTTGSIDVQSIQLIGKRNH